MPVSSPASWAATAPASTCPKPEEDLVQAVAATGKPLVVVLMNGQRARRQLGEGARQRHPGSLVLGRRGRRGHCRNAERQKQSRRPAAGHVLQGRHQLPHFEDYSMKGRTYRYFEGEPLWPVWLWTQLHDLQLQDSDSAGAAINAGDPLEPPSTVTNTGKLAGDEVVQLYLNFPGRSGRPDPRIARLQARPPGTRAPARKSSFTLKPRTSAWSRRPAIIIVAEGKYTVSIGGGQPGTCRQSRATLKSRVE